MHDVLEQHGLPADDFHEEHGGWDTADDGQQGDRGAEEENDTVDDARGTQDAQDADSANDTGDAIFQPSYNFAPGYRGIVLRPSDKSSKSDKRAGQTDKDREQHPQLQLQLQVMKWGLVPSWMNRRPDYATMLKTINCRADSLATGTGMWASLRGRKRCVVVAQGFYEWLKTGPKERVPHYIRRRDGLPLLLAGLWDSVAFEQGGDDGATDKTTDKKDKPQKERTKERTYTYTIITTDSNTSLRFLHDRMPVVFDYQSPELHTWLDPGRDTWSSELQALLRPWPRMADDDGAALLVDVVSKDVNKAGHSAASFIVPVASESNKANIANFFRGGKASKEEGAAEAEAEKRERGEKRETEEAEAADAEQPAKRTRLAASPSTTATIPPTTATTPTTPVKNAASTRPASVSASASKANQGRQGIKGSKGHKGHKATARTPSKKDDKSGGSSQKITSFFGLKNG